ncbi:DsbA family oxidoreductase [Trueperella bialowiezensis]|uniref:Protein-disulfide isomerase n=1 Tax=Trueperella bialowiezensis TaxID=312285 RepID=A0A448PEK1_9ACTO|nr:DsbA family oxidoreductase [Trueperella bialowiezensis]VEI13371.1 Protein-disulfide isomerase [Trueperella bialowiezensis]
MAHQIVVHVWSDIACPWCWIGKQRLEKGIELSGKDVAVEYHSYQLYPDASSSEDRSYAQALADIKNANIDDVVPMIEQVAEVASAEGLELNWQNAKHVGTFLAHQFVYAAKAHGNTAEEAAELGGKAFERLYRAHFSEGRNVGDTDTLLELAEDIGLDVERVSAELESGEHANSVRSDIRDARSLGIQGVPFFVVGGKFGISGAQPPQVYADTINRALAEIQYARAQEVPVEIPEITSDDGGVDRP